MTARRPPTRPLGRFRSPRRMGISESSSGNSTTARPVVRRRTNLLQELIQESQLRLTRPTSRRLPDPTRRPPSGSLGGHLLPRHTGIIGRRRRPPIATVGRPPTGPLDLSEEVTHAAPMTPQQIKWSIESRPDTNQDIKFMEKKKCGVCLGSWKEILMEGKHLVFTECGHIFCRDCAIRIASEGTRECPLCKKSLAGVNPPFRRLHMPLDPRLKKRRAD